MVSLIESSAGATSNALATSTIDLSDGAVLQETDKTGEDWIIALLSNASPDAIAAGTAGPGEVDLMDPQFYEEEEHEITITARRYTGTSYYWDGGNDGTTSWGGDGGGGGGSIATPVAQHTQDCGSENGAAVQVAKHVKGELPPGVSGPVDPLKTSSGNDWTKVEFGTMIVKNSDGSFGAINDTIYSSNLPGDIQIHYNAAQPVQGFWHSHPAANLSTGDRLIGRYPSLTDWNMLDRIEAGAGAVSDPSLWIMDSFGTTREFKFSERDYFKSLLNDDAKMRDGEGLEGKERSQSCG